MRLGSWRDQRMRGYSTFIATIEPSPLPSLRLRIEAKTMPCQYAGDEAASAPSFFFQ